MAVFSKTTALVWPAALFLFITVAVMLDTASDLSAGAPPLHLLGEALALGVALLGVFGTARELRRAQRTARSLHRDLEAAEADLARSRADAQGLLRGLRFAIDRQFHEWRLSSGEREVALLILKGLSYQEIADALRTSHRTVVTRARTIHRKAALTGGAEMASFLLDDLLLPRDTPLELGEDEG
jgi:DNA-binding CsgD family transcriptional regulator